jgi:serine/threonine protein kinase
MIAGGSPTGRIPPNTLLKGRYLIHRLMGQGGMGAVYEAVDTQALPQRRVAVKELSLSTAVNSDRKKAVRRFQREARMLRSLSHPNLPRVYDSFNENGRYYLVMDFIQGQTLAEVMDLLNRPHPLSYTDVLAYACQLCSVLDYLHRQDPPIIFRDLKPQNVMVTPGGHLYLIDFGIARVFKPGQGQDTEPLGTAGYAAPEVYNKKQSGPRSDLYSLGATLYCCLTALSPLSKQPLKIYAPSIPPSLDALVYELLADAEDNRPKSAFAVWQRLDTIIIDEAKRGIFMKTHIAPSSSAGAMAALAPTAVQTTAAPVIPRLPSQWRHDLAEAWKQLRTLSSPVLTPHFIVLLLARLVVLIIASGALFQATGASFPTLSLLLALFLLLHTVSACASPDIRDRAARGIFLAAAVSIALAVCALAAIPAVQQRLHALTVNQSLALLLLFFAAITLLRASKRLVRVDRVTAIGIAGMAAWLQYGLGAFALAHLSILSSLSPAALSAVNDIVVALLVACALLLLCRLVIPISGFDRFLLWLVALGLTLLAYAFGYQELMNAPLYFPGISAFFSSDMNIGYAYILLLAIPALLATLALFTGKRWAYASRLALFIMAIAVLTLQNTFGSVISLRLSPRSAPFYPLAGRVGVLLTLNQALTYILIAAGLTLLVRLASRVGWLDRAAIFAVAIACAFLQSAFWSGALPIMRVSLATAGNSVAVPAQLSTVAFNQLVAAGLFLVVACGLALSLIILLAWSASHLAWVKSKGPQLERRFAWVNNVMNAVDRIVVLGIIAIAALLLASFGSGEYWYQQTLLAQPGFSLSSGQVILLLLALLVLIALIMAFFPRPLSRWSRFTALAGVIVLLFLVFADSRVQHITAPITRNIQQAGGSIFQGDMAGILSSLGLLAAAGISLLWLKRAAAPGRVDYLVRYTLLILFAGSIACILLQSAWAVLLPVACILLILGQFVALQMELVK